MTWDNIGEVSYEGREQGLGNKMPDGVAINRKMAISSERERELVHIEVGFIGLWLNIEEGSVNGFSLPSEN